MGVAEATDGATVMASPRKASASRDQNDLVSDDYVAAADVPEPSGAKMGDMAPFIWQQLSEIQKGIGGIEAKQQAITDRLGRVEDKTGNLSDKIGRLVWGMAGAGILITVMFGIARFVPIKISLESSSGGEVGAVAKPEAAPTNPS